jgi:hypothetical protein
MRCLHAFNVIGGFFRCRLQSEALVRVLFDFSDQIDIPAGVPAIGPVTANHALGLGEMATLPPAELSLADVGQFFDVADTVSLGFVVHEKFLLVQVFGGKENHPPTCKAG